MNEGKSDRRIEGRREGRNEERTRGRKKRINE